MSLQRNARPIDIAAGRVSLAPHAAQTAPSNLFQIGSNTKAFTAVTLLQLEAAGKLSIDDRLGKFLPHYPAWKNVTIHRLLDMTSGIPSYDNQYSMLHAYALDPYHDWSAKELVATVYGNGHPKRTTGWSYSNTNYILGQMIIERVTGNSYALEIRKRFLTPQLGLTDTYYQPNRYPAAVARRLVSGYFANTDPDNAALAPLLDKDVRDYSLSWTQGAGGIVSTPAQIVRWVRALYEGPVLPARQRAELMTIVSNQTGKPIAATSLRDPRGFGLAVGQLTMARIGTVWYYEGETLGYRMLYAWFPKNDAVIAIGLNSQPPSKEDRIGQLLSTVYETLGRMHQLRNANP